MSKLDWNGNGAIDKEEFVKALELKDGILAHEPKLNFNI